MSKYLDENGLLYLWEKITDAIDPKADKVPEVNHGTSDTTFTLTPNIMHIWGEIATLNLTLSADSNSVLDEYMFTFTCPSAAATNLTLPSSIKWIQQPELLAGKTYLVSIVNGLAGYLTDDMPATGQDNIIETIKVNGTALIPDANKAVDITVPQGTVTSVTVNGSNYTPDANGLVNLGTISGGSDGGEANVIESVKVNGTALTVTNKAVDITTVPASIVTQDATHRFVSDTEKSTWNSKASTDTKNTAGATATTVTGSNKLYLIGASEQTANPTTNTINYFYVDASGLNIPTNINALSQTATLGNIILPGTGGGILADGTGGILSTTKVWNTFGSYTDISGFATDSNVVHKSGEETIAGDKTFSGQVSFSSDNPVYFFGDNMVRGDVYITNLESGATNVQITTDDNNDNRVVVKASETGFSWIQASNGTLDLQSVLDAKLTSSDIPTLSKGTTTGSGNAVTDISVSGHTVTLTKGSTFLTSYTETDPTVPAAVKAITATDISNWNSKLAALVSGTNIKTVNSNSLLGSGNIAINADTIIYNSGSANYHVVEEGDSINMAITNLDDALHTTQTSLISNKVTDVVYDSTNKKLTQTKGSNTTDIVTAATIVSDGGGLTASDMRTNYGIYVNNNTLYVGGGGLLVGTTDIGTGIMTAEEIDCNSIELTEGLYESTPANRAANRYFATNGTIQTLTTIYSGSSTPSSSLGSNGDIYIKTS